MTPIVGWFKVNGILQVIEKILDEEKSESAEMLLNSN
jgi:hypothetical protein